MPSCMLPLFSGLYRAARLTILSFFFFNDTATTEIYTLSLHDALPIFVTTRITRTLSIESLLKRFSQRADGPTRSEEHTSELQSQSNLVCRLLLEKKKRRLLSLPPTPHLTRRTPGSLLH